MISEAAISLLDKLEVALVPKRLTVQEYVDGIQRGEKRYIAQGITLIESSVSPI